MDKDGNKVGESSVTAARWGISQVIHLQAILEPETYYLSLKIAQISTGHIVTDRYGCPWNAAKSNPDECFRKERSFGKISASAGPCPLPDSSVRPFPNLHLPPYVCTI